MQGRIQMNQLSMNTLGVQGAAGPLTVQRDFSARPNAQKFTDLDGDDFRHPLDQQNTGLLRSLPGLEAMAKAILGGPGFEQALYLENIGAAVKVGENQLPTIHRLLIEACDILNMDPPGLYVRQVRADILFPICTRIQTDHSCDSLTDAN